MGKKILSLILAMTMIFSMTVPTMAVETETVTEKTNIAQSNLNESDIGSANSDDELELMADDSTDQSSILYSGISGDLNWSIDSDGVLKISGTGDYALDSDNGKYPKWYDFTESITSAIVDVKGITSTSKMFYNCRSMTSVNIIGFDTSNVTNMSEMFADCRTLRSLDFSKFDTSNVTDMSKMFDYCESLSQLDLTAFNTSKVIDMSKMFVCCRALTNLDFGELNTKNVTNMSAMFEWCDELTSLDLSKFDTSKVTDMSYMFYQCGALINLDLSGFNTSKVTDMSNMFYVCTKLTNLNLNGFDTSNVTSMSNMFYYCTALSYLDVSGFDTSNVTNMSSMFYRCQSLTSLDVSGFDTSNATNMSSMFYLCKVLSNLNLNGFDFSKVLTIEDMFSKCPNLSTSINLTIGSNTKYSYCFTDSATDENAKIFVKYSGACTKELASAVVATKSDSSHVYLDEETASLDSCTVTLGTSSYTYDGTAKQPSVTVKDGTTTLEEETDYTVSYSNNTNAGTATVTITGKGNYAGTATKNFTINKAAAGLSFANASLSKKTTDTSFTNTLTKATEAAVTYSSSDTSVATVNDSGEVTIQGEGTSTIIASVSETDNYEAGSDSYTLTIEADSNSGKCGENLIYNYDSNSKKLTISGTGAMYDYDNETNLAPWFNKLKNNEILYVTIEEGVSSIGAYAFNQSVCNPEPRVETEERPEPEDQTEDPEPSEDDNNLVLTEYETDSDSSESLRLIINIASTVKSIGNGAFSCNDNLYQITIPDSVTSIGERAFICCSNLTSVTIGSGITAIEAYTFNSCSKLSNVTIGKNVISIDKLAFSECRSLLQIEIPDNVTSIGYNAFAECENLSEVSISKSVTSIDITAFYNCKNLENIEVSSDNEEYSSVNGALYNKKQTSLILVPNGKSGAFDIADSVKTIEENALYGCNSLTEVTIPNSVTTISDSAFSCCYGLTDITIPNSVTKIGQLAFSGCDKLTSVTIPNSVLTIGDAAFLCCNNLQSVIMSDSVTSLGDSTFADCYELTDVTLSKSISVIDSYTFYNCEALTSIAIPESVTTIESSAFSGCSSLTDIYFAGSESQWSSISGHDEFEDVTIHTNSGKCGKNLFYEYDSSSNKLTISGTGDMYDYDVSSNPAPWVSVINNVRVNNYYDADIVIENGATSIGAYAFPGNYQCAENPKVDVKDDDSEEDLLLQSLDNSGISVTIPSTVKTIGWYAFSDNKNIYEITIPSSVTSIGYEAFYACTNLKDIYFTGSKEQWDLIDNGTTGTSNKLDTNATIHYADSSTTEISDCTITLSSSSYIYDGSEKKPEVTVTDGSATLVQDTDYTVSYSNNTNAGSATVTITGKGNYTGTATKTFTINKAEAGLAFASSSISKKTTDSSFTNALLKETDGSVTYSSSNTSVATVSSTGTVTIKGVGTATITASTAATTNYNAGSASYTLTVTSGSIAISSCTVTLGTSSYTYDGTAKQPSVTVKNGTTTLTIGTDYTVSYSNNTNAGTATVTITGKGNYTGTTTKTFTINKAEAGLAFASSSISKKTTDSSFTNILTKETDGTIIYSSSDTSVATVSSSGVVTIKGVGTATITANTSATTNYNAGFANYTLTVTSVSISSCTITLGTSSYTYDGTEKKPSVAVKDGSKTLAEGTDYTVSYTNNTNVGTASVTITGKGNYTGTATKTFSIDRAEAGLAFANTSVSKKITDSSFTNALTKATDATVSYASSNTSVATVSATGVVTIKGAGTTTITASTDATTNFNAGSASYTLAVTSLAISNCTITLGTSSYTYDGTAKQPAVTVKNGTTVLTNGTDYSVSYSNNINVGTATVTITGKGNYSGTTTKTFTINKATAGLSFASSSISKKTTDSSFTNSLTKKTDGSVTYSSSNTSVATVGSSGAVTIKGTGTATITASTAATTNYNAGSASYTLTVTSANSWTTSNEFWFSNSSTYFRTGKYTMLDSDFTKLCNYIKKNYTSSSATNIINRISAYRDETWGGSCFGMAASTLLDYSGQIGFNENFDSGKSTMHDVSSPNQNSKVQSAINYYFMAQMIPMTRNINKCYSKGSSTWALGLKQLISQAKNGNKLLFCYFTSSFGHAIVVKGYDGTDTNGNYRLIAYDNRYPNKDTIVLISSSYSTCTVNGSENALSIEYTSDMTAYDKIDIDGPNNNMVISSSSSSGSQSINGTEIYVTLDSDIEIMNSSGQYIKIEDGLVTDSTIDILDTHMIVCSTADGTSKPAELVLNVSDSDYFSFESNGTQIAASVLNANQYSSVEASGADGVVLSSSEGISILGSNATYKVYQSVDEDDFEMFSFEGTTSSDANISYSDRTISVTGNAPGSINVTTYSEDDTEELTFDTTKSKVNINIPDEQVHTHEKGTHHAIVKATCSANGSIEYWDCTGCDKKLDKNGNEITTTIAIAYPKTFTLSATSYAYDGKVKTPTLKIYDSKGKLISSSNYTITYPTGRKNVGTYTYKVTFKGSYYSGTKNVSFKIVPKIAAFKKVSVGKRYITVYSSAKASSYAGTGFQIAYRVSGTSIWKYTTTTSTSKKVTGLTKGKKYEVIIRAYKKIGSKTYYGAWSSKKISAAVK